MTNHTRGYSNIEEVVINLGAIRKGFTMEVTLELGFEG